MKFLMTARPGTTNIKLKYGASLFQAAKEWIQTRLSDGTFDCHYVFIDLGGLTILNAESSEAVFEMILDYPLYPFFEWEVTALCDWQHGYDKNIEYFKKLAK
ncbi:MAG: hypothetical protein JSV31_02395 [Desulfobacterales bacterium]|nr:MAG: hypothetical protein JSV31_02395 [Desulfobacterales bacterium]